MATITLKGNAIHTNGNLPAVGSQAPEFVLQDSELKDVSLATYKGKKKLLNIVPSLDTPVCATSTKKFNSEATKHQDAVFLMISADLPFAQKRFCSAEGTSNVVTLSMMRNRDFAKDYGVLMEDGPFAGIAARAVVVLDAGDKIVYTQLVPELSQEPDYARALTALV